MSTATQDKLSTEDIALAIFDDLMSENPTYAYDMDSAGDYARQLTHLLSTRKNYGLDIAKQVLETIKAMEDSELATLLRQRDEKQRQAKEKERRAQATSAERLSIPPLPEYARLPEVCLPRLPASGGPGAWYSAWDDTALQQVAPTMAAYIHYSHRRSPEGYVDFHPACYTWMLSTIAARRVRADLDKRIYTPLMQVLAARTSLFAKSTTAEVGLDVMRAAGLGFLLGPDEITPQKMLVNMGGLIPSNYGKMDAERQERARLRVAMAGQIGWYYDEFNQMLDAMMRPGPYAEFAGLLRKMDNCPPDHKYETITHKEVIIQKPYLAFLASTTPANLKKYAVRAGNFWNDGFWARFAIITPPPDAFYTHTFGLGYTPTPDELIKPLSAWNTRLGVPECLIVEETDDKGKGTGVYIGERDELPETVVSMASDAHRAYVRYREAMREMIAANTCQDLDGSYTRLADKAIRIAVLIASLENNNFIDMRVWTLAQECAELFRRNLHEFYAQVNTSQSTESPLEDALIEWLCGRNGAPATAREIGQFGPSEIRRLGSKGIRELLMSLERSGVVQSKKEGKKESWSLCK